MGFCHSDFQGLGVAAEIVEGAFQARGGLVPVGGYGDVDLIDPDRAAGKAREGYCDALYAIGACRVEVAAIGVVMRATGSIEAFSPVRTGWSTGPILRANT